MSNVYRVNYVNGGVLGYADICTNTPQEAAAYVASDLATPLSEGTALILGSEERCVDIDMDDTYWVAPEAPE